MLAASDLAEVVHTCGVVSAAQPFGDGNKRTAALVANGLLIARDAGALLTFPIGRTDEFHQLLARTYTQNSDVALKHFLRTHDLIDRR